MKKIEFKKPNAATIWGLVGGVASIVSLIASNRKEADAVKALEDSAAEKAAKLVFEKLSNKED